MVNSVVFSVSREYLQQLSVAVALPVFDGSVEAEQSIVILAGQVKAGGVLSSIVIIWTQVVRLLHESTAVHVRVSTSGQEPALEYIQESFELLFSEANQ